MNGSTIWTEGRGTVEMGQAYQRVPLPVEYLRRGEYHSFNSIAQVYRNRGIFDQEKTVTFTCETLLCDKSVSLLAP